MSESPAALNAESRAKIEEVRTRIHNSTAAIIALGDGGWNHGAALMRRHADAMHALKSAEALLADDADADA